MEQLGFKSLGVNYLLDKTSLKKDLLYFDKILFDVKELERSLWLSEGVGESMFGINEFAEKKKFKLSEINFLLQAGLIEDFDSDQLELDALYTDLSDFLRGFEHFTEEISISQIFRGINSSDVENLEENAFRTFFISSLLNYMFDKNTVPIIGKFKNHNHLPHSKDYKIVEVVLNKFPIIDDTISWEHVVDFKLDQESSGKFLALRNWMIDISKGNYSVNEVSEKLDFLYNEYSRHLERHKIKTTMGIMKSFIVTSTEILEDIVKINWSKAVRTLFELFELNLKLIDLKDNAPGKEVAYVHSVYEEFK